MAIVKLLESAKKKLGADNTDDEGALELLTDAWRDTKHPRIATLIDRVSDRIRDSRPALTDKTVKGRTEKWIKIAKKKNLADLGTLLATPWPGTWKEAVPVLEALCGYPVEPRAAMALAKIVAEAPYDTWTSKSFYSPALSRIARTLDVRTLPILVGDLDRKKSGYWERGTKPIVIRTIAKLEEEFPKGAAPALADAEEKAIASIEALFAGDVADEKARAKGEGDFLAAIYADPFDDAARMVYADFLTERNDPRGELISLQMARAEGRGTEESLKREKTLLRKHGKAWLGTNFDRILSKEHRVFERGFLTEVAFNLRYGSALVPKELTDPAFATVTRIEMSWVLDQNGRMKALLALPGFRFVRGLYQLSDILLAELLKDDEGGPPPPCFQSLTELEIQISSWASAEEGASERRTLIANTKALPNVKRLEIVGTIEEAETVLAGSTLGKGATERITLVHEEYPLAKLLVLLEKLKLDPKEVAVSKQGACAFVLRRDEEGKRSRLHVEPRRVHEYHGAEAFTATLAGLPANQLTELKVDPSFECEWDEGWLRRVEEAIAQQTSLKTLQVSWTRLDLNQAKKADLDPATETLRIDLWGSNKPLDSKGFAKVWEKVGQPPIALTAALDAYVLNYGGHTPLKSPEDLAKLFDKKRTQKVEVYKTGGKSARAIDVHQSFIRVTCPWSGEGNNGDAEAYAAWLKDMFREFPFQSGGIDWSASEPYELRPFDKQVEWMWMLDAQAVNKLIPFEAIAKLPKKKGLEWLRAEIVQQTAKIQKLLLTFGPTPNQMPKAADLRLFELAMCDLLWAAYRKERGYVPPELFTKIVGPVLKKAGFVRQEPQTDAQILDVALGAILFTKRKGDSGRAVYFEVAKALQNNSIYANIELRYSDKPDADLFAGENVTRASRVDGGWIKDGDEAKSVFERIANALPEKLNWFDAPASTN